jgi:hypothetical protein
LILLLHSIECPLPPQSPDDPRLVVFCLRTCTEPCDVNPPIQHSIAPFLMQPGSNVTIAVPTSSTRPWTFQSSTPPPPLPPTAGTTGSLGSAFFYCLPVHPLLNRGINIRFPHPEKTKRPISTSCVISHPGQTKKRDPASVRSFPLGRAAKARTSSSCASCSRESVGCLPAHFEGSLTPRISFGGLAWQPVSCRKK